MENNDFSFNYAYMNVLNSANKNLSPEKVYPGYQFNPIYMRENMMGVPNISFNNNPLSYYETPKKDYQSLRHESLISSYASNSKIDCLNNNLLITNRKNSLNNRSPFQPMINSPFPNSNFKEQK